jgi:hypothetical protein
MDWIDLAQDRDRWRALVNTVMDLRSSINCREVLELAAQMATSQLGLWSMELAVPVLTSASDGDVWPVPCLCRFTPG